jgi:hypothetical protein
MDRKSFLTADDLQRMAQAKSKAALSKLRRISRAPSFRAELMNSTILASGAAL